MLTIENGGRLVREAGAFPVLSRVGLLLMVADCSFHPNDMSGVVIVSES
jgi:hypothetical protein